MHRTLGFVLSIVCIATVSGCTANSASKGVEEGTLFPMNTEEILAAVTGNSEVWPGYGAGYYQEDGTFLGIWKGDEAQGPWWVENDVRCYDVEEWGGEWCHEFYRRGDEIVLTRQGTDTILPSRIEEGNKL